MPIRLQFTLTLDDYVAAQRLHAKRGWWPRLILVLAYTLVPFLGVLWLLFTASFIRIADSPALFVFELGVGYFLSVSRFICASDGSAATGGHVPSRETAQLSSIVR